MKNHTINLVVPDDIWRKITRFQDLTGCTYNEIVVSVLREDLDDFFREHPDLIGEEW